MSLNTHLYSPRATYTHSASFSLSINATEKKWKSFFFEKPAFHRKLILCSLSHRQEQKRAACDGIFNEKELLVTRASNWTRWETTQCRQVRPGIYIYIYMHTCYAACDGIYSIRKMRWSFEQAGWTRWETTRCDPGYAPALERAACDSILKHTCKYVHATNICTHNGHSSAHSNMEKRWHYSSWTLMIAAPVKTSLRQKKEIRVSLIFIWQFISTLRKQKTAGHHAHGLAHFLFI